MKMQFKTESAAINYYRTRGWDYSGGKKSDSRDPSSGDITLMKPSRIPDHDDSFGGYQYHFLAIQGQGNTWFAKFDRASNW
jgi:hypothetical protein